ncbi:MAG: helix-turn-helix domain-containing protein [Rikenellaceae bacterium]
MKDKLAYLMKSEGLTTTRMAEILDIQPSGVSHIISGRNNPRFDLLQKILRRFPRINPDWLLLDAPNVYRDDCSPTLSGEGESGDFSLVDLFGSGSENAPIPQPSTVSNFQRESHVQSAGSAHENRAQNQAHLPPQFAESSASVERIIILYSDNTFRTYKMR